MAGDIKLRLYAQGDIDLQDPNDQNSDLASKYNIGLFDMAYLLAISLNEEFLRPNLKKSYFGYRKDLTKSKKLLEKTKSELPRKPFYSRLIDLIDEYLQDINIGLGVTRKPSGESVYKRTKLVLLWTYILRKGKIISGDPDSSDSKSRYLDEMHEIKRAVDWNDFYILLRWFHSKLKDCSYSAIIKPNGKKKEENEKKKAEIFYSKSLLEKHYDEKNRTKHFYDARNKIWLYTSLQEYLNKDKKGLLKLTKRLKSSNINPYPVVQIKFNHDSVEIGELQEKKIVMKKYSLIEKNKIPKFEEYEKRISKPIFPMVIFPDREKFVDENYVPPFSRIEDS